MTYFFFNSFICIPQKVKETERYIWLPQNEYSEKMIENFISKISFDAKIFVENVFSLSFLKEKVEIFSQNEKQKNVKENQKIAFFVPSDTLAKSAFVIYSSFHDKKNAIFFTSGNQNHSDTFLKNHQLEFLHFNLKNLRKIKPDIMILFNDWGEKYIVSFCRWLKIPVICVQESVIDFSKKLKKMQQADFVFLQGIITAKELNREIMFITGNPRYENLIVQKNVTSQYDVMINCNFTYGIHEDVREDWLNNIIEVLKELELSYFISQHPRDTGNLSNYKNVFKSNVDVVESQIRNAKILITRFSSLAHESLLMDKYVVYFNPHKEKIKYDFEFNEKFIFYSTNKNSLLSCLKKIKQTDFSAIKSEVAKYLALHCIQQTDLPTNNIISLLKNKFFSKSFSLKDFIEIIKYWVKKLIRK